MTTPKKAATGTAKKKETGKTVTAAATATAGKKKAATATAGEKRATATAGKKSKAAKALEAAVDVPATRREPKGGRREELPVEPAVRAQIRELEAQLDRLIDEASRHDVSSLDPEDAETSHDEDDFDAEATLPVATPFFGAVQGSFGDTQVSVPSAAFSAIDQLPEAPFPPGPAGPAVPAPPESVFDTARELLSTDFYLRKWGRLAMRGRSEEVDDFGFDPTYDAKLKPVLDFLYTKYFRVETIGIESVPKVGRCVLVANHSGTLPLDGVMLKAAVKREQAGAGSGRDVRWLTEDFIYHMPFLGGAMNRLGAVRACQENAERLLAKESLVAVFPEGVKGIGKLFADRYRLQRFGRGGFIKLCLRTGTPIIPVAVVGAEETNPLLFKIEHLSKALGIPYVPVTPTFPLLGPLGLLPAPTKWRIQFGEPLDLSAHGPEAADDEILVGKLAERVRAAIQTMLDRSVGSRKSVFFG
jgi:1-acyl-sn-glycerol-3-phosphate acyltransferase